MIRALLLASFTLLTLPADAMAAKRPCLTLEQVQDQYPGRHAKYRSVNGHRWWFVGKRASKSEFKHCGQRKAATKSRGGDRSLALGSADAVDAKGGTDPQFGRQEAETGTKLGPKQIPGSPMFFGSDLPMIAGQAFGPRDTNHENDVSGLAATKSRGGAESRSAGDVLKDTDRGQRSQDRRIPLAGVAPGPRDTHSADGVDAYLCPNGCPKLRGMVIKPGNPDWPRMSAEARAVFIRDVTEARRQSP